MQALEQFAVTQALRMIFEICDKDSLGSFCLGYIVIIIIIYFHIIIYILDCVKAFFLALAPDIGQLQLSELSVKLLMDIQLLFIQYFLCFSKDTAFFNIFIIIIIFS